MPAADRLEKNALTAESHRVAGPPRGEPLPAGRVGVRVRIPLTGTPSARWSRVLSARLNAALVGHPAIGHLELGQLVQGADIVLEGVEAAEADHLGPALSAAIAAANRASRQSQERFEARPNMSAEQAGAIARRIRLRHEPSGGRMPNPARFPGR